VPNPDLSLKPGMYAQARIVLDRRNDVLALPTQAVSLTTGTPNVWIVNRDDTIEQRSVNVGLQTANSVEVTGGLQVGDRVLLGDRSALSVGEKVQPKLTAPIANV
jgi:multidrug efflux pump subunit AcrA (membrane-fusion protein)